MEQEPRVDFSDILLTVWQAGGLPLRSSVLSYFPYMTKNVKELFDLSGRTAIVTGGSRGIGKEMAEGLAEAGANLMLCARRSEWLDATVSEFQDKGFTVAGKTCDVGKPDEVEAVVTETVEKFGSVDILINESTPKTPDD